MFRDTRRKKLRNRIIFSVVGAFVLSFGVWLNYQSAVDNDAAEEAAQKVRVEEDEKAETETSGKKETISEGEETGTAGEPESYLIKEVDGVVKVFICDEKGNKELYLITSIPFDLLSENDQQLFVDGVTIETEEDLGEFLQNFES